MTRQEVSRSVLSGQVKDRLLQAILDGRYPPGARIVETRVARELGTSQAPVREALRDLEGLGVIETTAFRGARVRRPSTDELLEAFVVRAELESLGARLAIGRLTETDLDELGGYVAEMQGAADAGDVHREATADAAFHSRIVALAGNATLVRVWRTLEPFLRTYITIVAPGSDRRRIADRHEPVLDALRRRDPELVTVVLHRHFDEAARSLASHWPSPPEERSPDAVAGRPGLPGPLPELASAVTLDSPQAERTS